MKWLIRKALLWAAPELKGLLEPKEPAHDAAGLDRIARENKN